MITGIEGPARNGKDTVGAMLANHQLHKNTFAFADKIKDFLLFSFYAPQSIEACKEGEQEFTTNVDCLLHGVEGILGEAVEHFGVDIRIATIRLLSVLSEHTEDFLFSEDGKLTFKASWRSLMQCVGTEWGRGIHEDFWVYYLPEGTEYIVTDVRRDNEAKAIINKGGLIVRVVDPRKGHIVRHHISESGIDESLLACTIINDGSLEDLEEKVTSFVYSYLLNGEC